MFLVMGESLVDVISGGTQAPTRHVGGSPLNVAVGLARLGQPVTFVTRYGRDADGELIHAHLAENGVAELMEPDEHPTARALGVLDPAGAATYEFETLDWDLSAFTGVAAERAVEDASVLHIGSLGASLEPGAATVHRAALHARQHATVTFDPNVRPHLTPDRGVARERVEALVALSDVVKASDSDLGWLYPDRSPEDSAAAWLALGPALVVTTYGSDGARLVTDKHSLHVPSLEADVEDTVGAGDSFMAAILGALAERELIGPGRREALRGIDESTLHRILDFATRAAAITVSRQGANPPRRDELPA